MTSKGKSKSSSIGLLKIVCGSSVSPTRFAKAKLDRDTLSRENKKHLNCEVFFVFGNVLKYYNSIPTTTLTVPSPASVMYAPRERESFVAETTIAPAMLAVP